jgi:glycosyltransferase involved in cell wall biosynthesis
MLVLMEALRARGHEVDLICPEPPQRSSRSLWQQASRRRLDPIRSVIAMRSSFAVGDRSRVARLRSWLETDELAGPYDIVHCWHSRDHVLAARALRLGLPGPRVPRRTKLVRSLGHAEALGRWPWNRWLFGVACDGLVCVSDRSVEANRSLRGGRRIASTCGAIDFDALEIRRDRQEMRRALGVPEEAKLIGVVARMQAHRRFDLLFEALASIVRAEPNVHLVLIGRGTREDEVARRPVREWALEENVIFAGYRIEDYADVLNALDVFTFLVPGSDGTCRALLQAAAIGLPLVGTRRGAIPEIISNGETGLLVEENATSLAAAWKSLLEDRTRRLEMAGAARRDAAERFRPDRFAAWMERFYSEPSAKK